MITLKNITKVYDQKGEKLKVLSNLTLTIRKHEIFGIVGESGSGKSTLLRIINGLEEPNQGTICFKGISINRLDIQKKRHLQKEMSMIFQQFNLLSNLNVIDNVALPLVINHKKNDEIIKKSLAFVRLLNKVSNYPYQLSGGEKQRVAIARAITTQPKLLLCDEPTSSIDEQHASEIIELLKKTNHLFGTTIIIVSHDLEFIKKICQRVAILESGQIKEILEIQPYKDEKAYGSYYQRFKENLK